MNELRNVHARRQNYSMRVNDVTSCDTLTIVLLP